MLVKLHIYESLEKVNYAYFLSNRDSKQQFFLKGSFYRFTVFCSLVNKYSKTNKTLKIL